MNPIIALIFDDRRLAWVTVLMAGVLAFWAYGRRDLTFYDEPRYAGVAVETVAAESPAVPILYGEPYTEKPPLWFWIAGSIAKLVGETSYAFFLPNVLAHFLTVLLILDLGRRTMSRRAGAIAALAYAACPLSLHYARSAQLDPLLVFFEALAAWCFLVGLETRRARFGLLGALALGIGSLVKGHLVLLALLAPLAWTWQHRSAPWLRRPALLAVGVLITLLPFASWLAAVAAQIGWSEANALYFGKQLVDHTAGNVNHYAPIPIGTIYLGALAGMLPLMLFALGAFRQDGGAPARRTYLAWGTVCFAIFAITPAKREIYLLPIAVPFALAAGSYLDAFLEGKSRAIPCARAFLLFLTVVLIAASVAAPFAADALHALSVEAILLVPVGLLLGMTCLQALRARSTAAPVIFLLLLSGVSALGRPAADALINEGFGERAFGEAIAKEVPDADEVVVFGFTKAHMVRYFSRRHLVFQDKRSELKAYLADRGRPAFVVTKSEDARQLSKAAFFVTETLAVESDGNTSKDKHLLRVDRAERDDDRGEHD